MKRACIIPIIFAALSGSHAMVRFAEFNGGLILAPGFGGWYDIGGVMDPELLWDGSLLRLYYTAVDAQGVSRIALAVSTDAVEWSPYGVVLGPGSAGTFDSAGVAAPDLVVEPSGYTMHYTAMVNGWRSVGRIKSSDGLGFDRSVHPAGQVLAASMDSASFDWLGVSDPTVVRIGGYDIMMYEGHDGSKWKRLGLAYAADADDFNRVSGTEGEGAVFGRGPHGFDDGGALEPELLLVNGEIRLFYTSLHY
ncbi:hypothetical protein JW905_05865 [bacterium]|nr:hypothetical protein [candidate division CSSED10-310 bacterium]